MTTLYSNCVEVVIKVTRRECHKKSYIDKFSCLCKYNICVFQNINKKMFAVCLCLQI